MKIKLLISIFTLTSFVLSQSMYIGNSKKNVYSVYSFYHEGENKTFTLSENTQNSYC